MSTSRSKLVCKNLIFSTALKASNRQLSAGKRVLNTSFTPPPTTTSSPTTPSPPFKTSRPTKKKLGYSIIGIVAFFAVGSTVGYYSLPHAIPSLLMDTQLPEPGSAEESKYLQNLEAQIRQVPIVFKLTENPKWKILRAWNLVSEDDNPQGLVTPDSHSFAAKLLGKPGGIAVPPIIFASTDENSLPKTVTVIHCGTYLSGFPAIVHGGILGTFLEETMGRVALNCPESRNILSVNQTNMSSTSSKSLNSKPWWKIFWWGDRKSGSSATNSNSYDQKFTGLKTLSINYKSPTLVDQFIVIKATVKGVTLKEGKCTIEIEGIIENTKGKKLVVASGTYEG
ncbi:hypothetical protein NADFUDRAFT_41115 [Nadsonia fulvescens var. elongata DSM 6958]|uniref:Thioesterase domain-containing protein n=1 Tax=Nadsonia fulvescens var. elongata DSM 6958 TaxID=857566 RepID=A0A1E3PM05_9ASCO|nr:hypothetical protein NADFUDRAFT_41115 [Nadsonia fulvescens var. elongata DSM 6958]